MALVKDIRSYARQVIGPTLAVSVFAYFAYHAVEGDRSEEHTTELQSH